MLRKRATLLVPVGYAVLLATLSLLPSGSGRFRGWDAGIPSDLQNLLHVPAYGLLVVLTLAAWSRSPRVSMSAAAVAFLLSLGFGAALECAQAAIPGRTGSIGDLLLNVAGALGGAAAYVVWRRARATRPRPMTGAPRDGESAGSGGL